ncbi:MAG TPA: hypothetical protein DDY78_17605 [Planctomycetales bacterium]|jgi:hypothetical protein|nr:hypothetical protein [Planctomycetales bacterium]
MSQVHAVHELHQEIVKPVTVPEFVDSYDSGVTQLGQGTCFTGEPLGECRVRASVRPKDFQRSETVQLQLADFVHNPHTAPPQQFHDLKLREMLGQFPR